MHRFLVSIMSCVCASLLVVEASYAHTPLNPEVVLEFTIAKGGLTRISIDNDGIEDIYAYPTDSADNIAHHKSGHIFVVADDLKGPLYLTVITRRGVAQDLKLIPKSKKVEPIILHFEDKETLQQQLQENTTAILNSFVQGIVPAGFYSIFVLEDVRGHADSSLKATFESAYQDDWSRVLVFKVKNDSSNEITLDNRVFWEARDLASAFDQSLLNPNETGKLYVIQHRRSAPCQRSAPGR